MTNKEFEELLNYRLAKIEYVLGVKAAEYVRNNDRLHNFNEGSKMAGISRERVLDGFLLKHYISYRDMLNDLDNGKLQSIEYLEEKVGDILNYFILFEISMKDKIKKNEINK